MSLAPKAPGEVILEHVSRNFGRTEVLRDVSLRLEAGTVTEIVGENGVGKTSLLRILAGTLAPTGGRVRVSGSAPGRGMAALVSAGDRSLYWRLTGRQELEFFARVTGSERHLAAKVAAAAADALGVGDLLDRQIGTLSTGQRRRLMVARSLAARSPVLLMDEPYADLDDKAQRVVDEAAQSWAAMGGLVLWTSPTAGHGPSPRSAFRLADGRLMSE